ncbi:tyrosine-type recombinase/integrase [Bdellovibrionota bacterium FG-1]
MKNDKLFQHVQSFFQSHLQHEKGLSPNTISSYRDVIKLFFLYLAKGREAGVKHITFDEFTAENVTKFLDFLEKERGSSVRTRNQRLAVIKSFFSYLMAQDVSRVGQYERITRIAMKRTSHKPMTYLTEEEIEALLKLNAGPDPTKVRDYALLATLYNTGARVQEICDLKVEHLHLQKPFSITLTGKGRKTRVIPLWKNTVESLIRYINQRGIQDSPGSNLFVNANNNPITRFGVRHIVRTWIEKASDTCPSLRKKRIGPHTFRHTTAMHLLQSGVDLAVIQTWLDHLHIDTTHAYIEIDMKMKEQALQKHRKDLKPHNFQSLLSANQDVLKWLENLR